MVIGHASGIAASLRPGTPPWIAPGTIAACNLFGSLIAGRLADKLPPGPLLAAFALATTVALAGLAAFGTDYGLFVCLGLIGFSYGGTIAAYPAVIAKLFGMQESARVYARVTTAWGSAGLTGPWFAGVLFHWRGDYQGALLAAAAFRVLSFIAVMVLFRRGGGPAHDLP